MTVSGMQPSSAQAPSWLTSLEEAPVPRGLRTGKDLAVGGLLLASAGAFWIGLGYLAYTMGASFLLAPMKVVGVLYAVIIGSLSVVAAKNGLQRWRRLRVGTPDGYDVVRHVRDTWGSGDRWGAPGALTYRDACAIREAVLGGVVFGKHHDPTHSPAIVYRWLRSESPHLLVQALQADFTEEDLVAYMDGDPAARKTAEFMLALGGSTETTPTVAA